MEQEKGVIAGVYEIERKIGSGGAGIVYLGCHQRLDKKIVLKADKRAATAKLASLRREVDALKELNHPFIPRVYDFVAEGDTVYTVMDYIEGESLDKPLKRGERFPQAQVIGWACQLLDALRYLHTRPPHGILHSDIKPANIMLTPQGDICLIDFNIALALDKEGTVRVGYSKGYASPEHYGIDFTRTSEKRYETEMTGQATELLSETPLPTGNSGQTGDSKKRGVLLDVRSDIYSLGATLYHLLTGNRPPQDAREVPPIKDPDVSPAVAAILAKAMEPNPDDRYQTASEMLDAFRNLHRNDPRARSLRRTTLAVAAAMLLLFLVGGFLTFVGHHRIAELERNQARTEQSVRALQEGDVASAVRLAAQSLKRSPGFLDAPNAANTQLALTNALGVYHLESGFEAYRTLDLPSEPLKVRFSPDGTKIGAVYAWQLAIYDMETLDCLAKLDVEESALSDFVFLDEQRAAYAGPSGLCVYHLGEGRELWSGRPCTAVERSADGRRIATVFKDSSAAYVYDVETGDTIQEISFQGKGQWVAPNDRYMDHEYNLFSLNQDGTLLAASYEDGSLMLFPVDGSEAVEILEPGGYLHFEGGFYGRYFAFSAYSNADGCLFAVIDVTDYHKTVLFNLDSPVHVQADENGILLSNQNILVSLDPETGEQKELSYTEKDILSFHRGGSYVVASENMTGGTGCFSLYDRNAVMMERIQMETTCDFVDIAGSYCVAASHNTPTLRFMMLSDHADARIFTYDSSIEHTEARLSADGKTVMLFRYDCFRIFDMDGELITKEDIPDPLEVYDQQYRRSGEDSTLEVIYKDGFIREYSARDGSVLDERQGETPDLTLYEEFLTERFRITRTLHDVPTVFDRESGKRIRELEQDDTLAYVDQTGDNIITWYLTSQGKWYGLLLNEKCETLARLPDLCDVLENRLIFDYSIGELKESRIYSLEELLDLADAYQ